MLVTGIFRSRALVVGVAAALLLMMMPVMEFAQLKGAAPAPENGSMVGFIYGTDMKTPVPGAVVRIRNVGEQKSYDSTPTDRNGMYKITGIKEGRYILGVTAADMDFNFDYVMYLKSGEMAKLSVALAPGGQTSGPNAVQKSFFTSPAGIVLIVAAVGAILYAILHEESPNR
jgi:hypothetical protein